MIRAIFKLRFTCLLIGLSFFMMSYGCMDIFDVKDRKTEEYWIRAKDYIQRDKYHAALAELEHILKIDPKNDKAYYQCGEIYSLLKRRDKALKMYSKFAQINFEKFLPFNQ